MNFIEKDASQVVVEEGGGEMLKTPFLSTSTKSVTEKPVDISVTKDPISTKIDYKIRQVIPDDATITKRAIVVYGELKGVRKLVKMSDLTNNSFEIDNQYDNLEIDIDIEYEHQKNYYSLKEKTKLDKTKKLQINKELQGKEIRTTEEYLDYLIKRVDALENLIHSKL